MSPSTSSTTSFSTSSQSSSSSIHKLVWLTCCLLLCIACLESVVTGYPTSIAQNPFFNGKTPDALVDVTESGNNRDKFLRSFCRYCHSQPFFCGELLELCYAKFRL